MTDNKEKERAIAEAVKHWIEIYHPEEESYPAIERAAIVVGVDAGLATATTEIQRLRKALERVRHLIDNNQAYDKGAIHLIDQALGETK